MSQRWLSLCSSRRSRLLRLWPIRPWLRRWLTWGLAILTFVGSVGGERAMAWMAPASPPLVSPAHPSVGSVAPLYPPDALQLALKTPQAVSSAQAVQAAQAAQSLNRQAIQQFDQGQTEAALETWQRAETQYRQAQDPVGILGTQINQAQALQALGLYRRARSLMDQIQAQLTQQANPEVQALGYQSLGRLLQATGYLKDAQSALKTSLALAEQHQLDTSTTRIILGNTLRASQDWPAATAAYQQAVATAPDSLVRLEARLNLLSLWADTNQPGAVYDLLPTLQADFDSVAPSRRAVYARVNLAASLTQLLSGQLPSTLGLATPLATPQGIAQVLSTAVAQARGLQDSRAESYALGELGHLYERTRQWQEATRLTQDALILAQTAQADDIAYRWQWQQGRITVAAAGPSLAPESRQQAIAAYREAITTLRSIRGDLVATNPEIQASFQESIEPVYREFVGLLIQPDSNPEILQEARGAIEELQLAELENFFRSACLEVSTEKIDQIDAKAAVIYPIILRDRLEVLLSISGQPLTHHRIPVTQAEVEKTLDTWLQTLNPAYSKKRQQAFAREAYGWLIEPIAESLKQHQIETLVFVPDGAFRNLPLAALYDGQRYLIEDYQVALTPGLQLLEPRELAPAEVQALSLGLTQARQGFAALPGVKEEMEQIQANVPARVVLDEAFTKDNLRKQLASSNFPIVHLATHGQFSSDPDQTFLLTWDDTITVRDIRELLKSRGTRKAHPIELLVLSACQTAVGDRHAALGLAGLAVQSGARSTLATLWSVNDQSTALLMTELYEQLGDFSKVSRGESLRNAQLALLHSDRYSHPFYWSPFVLVGNWL